MNTTHLALKLPEIVGQILSFLVNPQLPDQEKNRQRRDIYQCLFVNSLWHDCAYRYMWRSVGFEDSAYGCQSFQKFASIVTNTPLEKSFHMQEEYSQWIALFSNKHSTSYSVTNTVLLTHKDPIASQEDYRVELYSHHVQYRDAVRVINLWKIKEKTANKLIQQMAPYLQRLQKIEFYICDTLTDSSVQSLVRNNLYSTLTYLSLAGCCLVTDESIIDTAKFCPKLTHLDLRACGQISDKSICAVAKQCPDLKHLNVGRVKDRERITIKSVALIAKHTQVTVLGLAGCEMTDECLLLLVKYRGKALERISVNNCYRISNKTIKAYARRCPNLSVFEMKECHWVDDWASVVQMVERHVLLTLCEEQSKACSEWARRHGKTLNIKAPVK